MTEKEKYSLLIWCGALWDISEKSKEPYSKMQIEEVRLRIENLCGERSQVNDVKVMKYLITKKSFVTS